MVGLTPGNYMDNHKVLTCLLPIAEQQLDSTQASLYLSVTNAASELLQGNVFVSLEHDFSRKTWRTLRWHRATRSFLFPDLPLGSFTYRVWASADRQVIGHFTLRSTEAHHESVVLPEPDSRPRLEFPIRQRLTTWRSRIAASRSKQDGYSSLQPLLRSGSAGETMLELLGDGAIVASITQPIAKLGITSELWQFIDAHTHGSGKSSIVGSRLRFLMITYRVGLNPAVRRRLSPCASMEQIWSAVIRVAQTLDDAALDDVFLWAARIYNPETARFEQFARAWAERFNGLKNLRSPAPLSRGVAIPSSHPRPELPPSPARSLDPAMVYASAPLLADIAHILSTLWEAR